MKTFIEKNDGYGHHNVWKHSDVEKKWSSGMKQDHKEISCKGGAFIKQQKPYNEVVQTTKPAEKVSQPHLFHQPSYKWQMWKCRQPGTQGLGLKKPVVIKLRDTSKKINKEHLHLQNKNVNSWNPCRFAFAWYFIVKRKSWWSGDKNHLCLFNRHWWCTCYWKITSRYHCKNLWPSCFIYTKSMDCIYGWHSELVSSTEEPA